MINNDRNMTSVSNPAYQEKVVVAAAIRAEIKPFLTGYARVFTEPRKDGLRSKFWFCNIKSPRKLNNALNRIKTVYSQYDIEVHGVKASEGISFYDVSLFIWDKK
jgi:hypothetical protein